MEDVAKKFEQDGIILELGKQSQESYYFPSRPNALLCSDETGYFPYCQIRFEEGIQYDATREYKPHLRSTFTSPKVCLAMNPVRIKLLLCSSHI